MSFSRANGAGWALGDVLTAAQINAIDIDHANAVDKTTAGDTVAGQLAFTAATALLAFSSSSPGITLATSTNKLNAGSNKLTVDGSGALSVNSGGSLTAASGATVALQAGSTTTLSGALNIASGSATTVQSGATVGVATGGLIALQGSQGPQQITLNSYTRTPYLPLMIPVLGTGWTWANWALGTPQLIGPATSATQVCYLHVHNGATLGSVLLSFIVTGPHASVGGGFVFPSVNIVRRKLNGTTESVVSLNGGGAQFASAASAAAWDNGNLIQTLTFTCNQNNVIDNTQYQYLAIVTDENGANSVSGNKYICFLMSYTGIGSMQFAYP